MVNLFQELQKRGYQITNRGLLYDKNNIETEKHYYFYSSEEEKRKDLIQELALVLDWFSKEHNIEINTFKTLGRNVDGMYGYEIEKWLPESYVDEITNDYCNTKEEATIAAIEYLIENKLI